MGQQTSQKLKCDLVVIKWIPASWLLCYFLFRSYLTLFFIPFYLFLPHCICFLWLCNIITTNSVIYNNTHLLSYNFCGPGVWASLSWVLFSSSHKTEVQASAGLQAYLVLNWEEFTSKPIQVAVGRRLTTGPRASPHYSLPYGLQHGCLFQQGEVLAPVW